MSTEFDPLQEPVFKSIDELLGHSYKRPEIDWPERVLLIGERVVAKLTSFMSNEGQAALVPSLFNRNFDFNNPD